MASVGFTWRSRILKGSEHHVDSQIVPDERFAHVGDLRCPSAEPGLPFLAAVRLENLADRVAQALRAANLVVDNGGSKSEPEHTLTVTFEVLEQARCQRVGVVYGCHELDAGFPSEVRVDT